MSSSDEATQQKRRNSSYAGEVHTSPKRRVKLGKSPLTPEQESARKEQLAKVSIVGQKLASGMLAKHLAEDAVFFTQETEKFPKPKSAHISNSTVISVSKMLIFSHAHINRRRQVLAMLCFLAFVIIYMYTLALQRNPEEFFETIGSLYDAFIASNFRDPGSYELKTFFDCDQIDDVWLFLSLTVLPKYYNDSMFGTSGGRYPITQQNRLSFHNSKFGSMTIMQQRTARGQCPISVFNSSLCPQVNEAGYSFDVGPYGPNDMWKFEDRSFTSSLVDSSSRKGYFVDLPDQLDEAWTVFNSLKDNFWVDDLTRKIQISFMVWNLNHNVVVRVAINFEIGLGGYIRRTFSMLPVRVDLYNFDEGIIVIRSGLEIFCVICIICTIPIMLFNIYFDYLDKGSFYAFFLSGWNWVDFISNILLYATVIVWLQVVAATPKFEEALGVSINNTGYVPSALLPVDQMNEITGLAYLTRQYFDISTTNVFFIMLRVLKFFRTNPRFAAISNVLTVIGQPLFFCVVTFATIFLMLVAMGHVLFGPLGFEWNTFTRSITTSLAFFLGEGSFMDVIHTTQPVWLYNRVGAYLWYYIYIFIMVFVILNLIIAVIVDGYNAVREFRVENSYLEHPFFSQLGSCVSYWFRRLGFACISLFSNRTDNQITTNECAEAAVALFDEVHAKSPIPDMSIQDLSMHLQGVVSISALKLLASHMTFCIESGEGSDKGSEKKEPKGGSHSSSSPGSPLEKSEALTLRAIIAAEKAIQSELSDIHDVILPQMEARQMKLLSAVVRGRMALNHADAVGPNSAATHSLNSLMPPKIDPQGFGRA